MYFNLYIHNFRFVKINMPIRLSAYGKSDYSVLPDIGYIKMYPGIMHDGSYASAQVHRNVQ